MFRRFLPLLLISLLLTGCNTSYLTNTSPTRIIIDHVEYRLIPYSPYLHDELKIDPLLCDLSLSTSFILTVKNLNPNPVKTNLYDSIAILDQTQTQYRPIKNATFFVHDLSRRVQELSPIQMNEIEISIQYQLDQPITTQNLEYYQVQLTELKRKVARLDQQRRIQDELTRRERLFKENLNVYGFRDQLLFSRGEHQGLIVFPPLTSTKSTSVTVLMLAGNGQILSFNYSLRP